MHIKRRLATTATAAVCAVGMAAGPAQAATTWSSYGVGGVHAQGSISLSYGYVTMSGFVRDTAADGHPVFIEVAYWTDGGRATFKKFWNETGYGTNRNFSYKFYMPTNGNISVMECVDYTWWPPTCSSRYTIYTN